MSRWGNQENYDYTPEHEGDYDYDPYYDDPIAGTEEDRW